MNYMKHYNALIAKAKDASLLKNPKEEYCEKHHILPVCLGGSNDSSNLINLTAKQHYIAHALLWKAQAPGTAAAGKLAAAFRMMSVKGVGQADREKKITSRLYEAAKKDFSKHMSVNQTGELNSQHGTCWAYTFDDIDPNGTLVNRKFPAGAIPEGWFAGRQLTSFRICKGEFCNKVLTNKSRLAKYCGTGCSRPNQIQKNKVKFMEHYLSNNYNMNKACIHIGIKYGCAGDNVKYCKDVIIAEGYGYTLELNAKEIIN
jgi:hypothetical protein